MSLLVSKDRCWYVKSDTDDGSELDPMTYAEALLVADMLVANKHKGVKVYRDQLQMVLK